MIRTVLLSLALSTGLAVIHSTPAYAQSTDQTDQSEEDWRKSKKKKNTTDILEDIVNIRNTGAGDVSRPMTPMESLPEESRRHLQKERAKLLANADMGGNDEIKSITDAGYKPSEAAKSDPDLAEQEKEAWDVILTDMKGGNGSSSGQAQDGPNKIAVIGQGGGQGSKGSRGSSTMRGGSSQSVADILAQIKGMQSAGGGGSQGQSQGQGQSQRQGPLGTGGAGQQQAQGFGKGQQAGQAGGQGQASGQGQQGQQQGQQGQQSAQNSGQGQQQGQQGQSQQQAQQQNQSQQQGQQQAQGQSDSQSQSQSQSDAQSAAQASASAQSQSDAAAQAQAQGDAQSAAQAQTQTPRETMSPLDRIKNSRDNDSRGRRTSASDYLNLGKKPD